jgi:hypothetical protein
MFSLDSDSARTIQERHYRPLKNRWPAFKISYRVENFLYNRVSQNGAGHDTATTILRNTAPVLSPSPIFSVLLVITPSEVHIADNTTFVSRRITSGMPEENGSFLGGLAQSYTYIVVPNFRQHGF